MTKVNIREALNQMDKDTNCKYDLVTLYEGYNFNDEEKKEIAKMISETFGSNCERPEDPSDWRSDS